CAECACPPYAAAAAPPPPIPAAPPLPSKTPPAVLGGWHRARNGVPVLVAPTSACGPLNLGGGGETVGEEAAAAAAAVTISGTSSCPGDNNGSVTAGAGAGASSSKATLAKAVNKSTCGEGFCGGGVEGRAVQSITGPFPAPNDFVADACAAVGAGPSISNGDVGTPRSP
ncbi:unnamed protein product, partial [Ectocarpus sp. 8 AP-2014]